MTRIIRTSVLVMVLLSLVACRVHYVELNPSVSETEIQLDDSRGVWVAVRPTQCSISDAWRKDWVAIHANDPHYPFGPEITVLQEFCSKQGVLVLDATTRLENDLPCSARTCSAHYTVFLLVREEDVDAIGELGGIPARPN